MKQIDDNLTFTSANEVMRYLDLAVRNEKKATHTVLKYINEVSARKLYIDLGYESLFKMLTERHKYSVNQAYDRIDAARVLKIDPTVIKKLESGSLNLTQLVKVGQCFKHEAKAGKPMDAERAEVLLAKLENKSIFETEKVLAKEVNFIPKAFQKLTPQSDESVRATMTFSAEQFAILQKAQNLISHSVPNKDLAEAIVYLAQAHIRMTEGKVATKKMTRQSHASTNKKSSAEVVNETIRPRKTLESRLFSKKRRRRKYLSVRTRRKLMTDANYECTFVNIVDGEKCKSSFCLQVDHVIPLARGGGDEITNLRVLCGFHNRSEAKRFHLFRPVGMKNPEH